MHTHYKGTGKVHSFRGLLVDGGQERIRIQGSVGAIAWRITKLQVMANTPGTTTRESVVKIYRDEQSTIDGTVDFNDNELLGVGLWFQDQNPAYDFSQSMIFDNALFVRNIYVTHDDVYADPGLSCNYYIELEEVTVSAAGMAQLGVAAARRRTHLKD